jgi:hypothetical protein
MRLSRSRGGEIEQVVDLLEQVYHVATWGNPGPPLAGGGNNNTVNLDAGNFGQITTQAGTPRVFQFRIKYAF